MNLYLEPPHQCPYLPEKKCQNLTFELQPQGEITTSRLIDAGFRHFGSRWFIPVCEGCDSCIGIKIKTDNFRPSKSQRRLIRKNSDLIVERGNPCIDDEKITLINRYHENQEQKVGWFEQYYTTEQYADAFINGNIWCEEYRIYNRKCLIGVGLLERIHDRASSVYFYYDPDYRHRSLGTWSVLKEIEICINEKREWLHLGLWNEDSSSLSYKSRFSPNDFIPHRSCNQQVEVLQKIFSE